jgi:putative tryptophan/tyrosine transport system substrate-binding protein
VRRRDLITLLGGATIAWPCIAMAQQPAGMRKIGVLSASAANDAAWQTNFAAFRQGLAALGWSEGQNVQFETRYAGGDLQHFESQATELVKSAPDVMLAVSDFAVIALKQRTRSIPIVFVGVIDPVRRGYVSSLSQPGANITGLSMYDSGVLPKLLQLLREIAPRTTRAVVAYYTSTPNWGGAVRSIEAAAKAARIDTIEFPLRSVDDIQRIARLGDRPDTSLIVPPSPFVLVHEAEIVKLAARYRLPAIYGLLGVTRQAA